LFSADFSDGGAPTQEAYTIRTAGEIGFKEGWLQVAIAKTPELVIAARREADLTDEAWMFWSREFNFDPGTIDVLLVSESGRVAIVETKLSYNREGRRTVLAQVLEYAGHLTAVDPGRLPPIPHVDSHPFVDFEIVQSRIQEGDYLLIIAGDRLDARAVKLSKSLLGNHLVNCWELALVELAVFETTSDAEKKDYLLVPHLRGAVIPDRRQVVRVVVEGDRTKVEVERIPNGGVDHHPRQKCDEERFFAELETAVTPAPYRKFGTEIRRLRDKYESVGLAFGSGKAGCLIFKKSGFSLLEFYIGGTIRFRREKFQMALGSELAAKYEEQLGAILPEAMKMSYPNATLDPHTASTVTNMLLQLLDQVLAKKAATQSDEPGNA
jgi:hypothetical protein